MVKTRKHRNYKGGGWWNLFGKPTDPQKLCVFENQNIIDLFKNMNDYAAKHNPNSTETTYDKHPYLYVKYINNEIIRKNLTNITDDSEISRKRLTLAYLNALHNFTTDIGNISTAIERCNSIANTQLTKKDFESTIFRINIALSNFQRLYTRLLEEAKEEEEEAKASAMTNTTSNGGKRKTKKTRKTQKKSRKSRKC